MKNYEEPQTEEKMTPEQLKVIAEGMGYEIICPKNDIKRFTVWDGEDMHTRCKYNPDTTNNDQMIEIMDGLKYNLKFFDDTNEWVIFDKTRYCVGTGKTINKAVCNAAYEYFSEKDK